jgi:glycine oxidase
MSERPGADVAIVGGGLVGLASAIALAREGAGVVVIERAGLGAEASSAAAGILGAQVEAHGPGPLTELCLLGRARWPEFAAALEEETGIDVGLRRSGVLIVALDAAEAEALPGRAAWQIERGLPVEKLGPAEVAALEPDLAPVVAALRFADDQVVDPIAVTAAAAQAARAAQVRFIAGEAVGVVAHGGAARGVTLAGGGVVDAGAVVLAAGSWSASALGEAAGLAPDAVAPVRGQLLELGTVASPSHIVFGAGGYLVPRGRGRVIVGSTAERVGYDKRVTPDALESLRARAERLSPALGGGETLRVWAGLRPASKDGLPYLGESATARLFVATGHFRNGILLGPITGEIVAALVLGRRPPIDLAPFAVTR